MADGDGAHGLRVGHGGPVGHRVDLEVHVDGVARDGLELKCREMTFRTRIR